MSTGGRPHVTTGIRRTRGRPPTYLDGLDPAVDYQRIYRHLVMREFWSEARMGLNMAFYRTYAVPEIARLLHGTGQVTGRPVKRAYDTGIVMYELIANGLEHPRGRKMLELLNRMHGKYSIEDGQYRYVLGALVFVPSRWIDKFGPRRLDPREREATFEFYRRVGAAMHIKGIPGTIAEFEDEFDAYEREHFAFDPAATALFGVTRDLVAQRIPARLRGIGWVRRAVVEAADSLLERPVRAALGVPEPPRILEATVHALLIAKGRMRRFSRIPDAALWTPGRANVAYPGGYTLDQIGPGDERGKS